MLKWAFVWIGLAVTAAILWLHAQPEPAPRMGETYGYPTPQREQPEPVKHEALVTGAAPATAKRPESGEFPPPVESRPPRPYDQAPDRPVLPSQTTAKPVPRTHVDQPPPTLAEFGYQRLPTAPPPGKVKAIALPTPQAWFVENTREVRAWHDSVEREPTDPNWSDAMASQISDFFVGDNLPRGYQPVTAHCRAAICENYAFAPEYGAYPRFGRALRKMHQQPWAETLARPLAYHTYSDGNTTILVFVERVSGRTGSYPP